MAFAEKTTVDARDSRLEIERLLEKHGADAFAYGTADGVATVHFRMKSRMIRFRLAIPPRNDPSIAEYQQGSKTFRRSETEIDKRHSQIVRSRWRALLLVIKAKLEAIDVGILTFEDEFLASTIMHNGQTVSDWIQPRVEEMYRLGKMPDVLQLTGPKS
ncbi:MAG: hypothetical protein ACRYG4_04250 [Janthinobacterium lividum]